ncbi:MAG: MBL fold metallo-hydrolase [Myxococcota bacterium]|jgi:alkyl sulfatase BDS1-like metallo-beta-lactamase superfamily hydrolase|nr:MBL fold metallo-hydrolase [Myxococcota bacterium]
MRVVLVVGTAVLFFILGLALGGSQLGSGLGEQAANLAGRATSAALETVAQRGSIDTRSLVLLENPRVMAAVARIGGFGGEFSRSVAMNMFSRLPEAIEDAREKSSVVELAPRSYLLRLPIVNAVYFDTDAGGVLVDTGMGPGGPAILDLIRTISDKPLHTIIYTHGHVDHAFGTWAIAEAGQTPQIVAHADLPRRVERYMKLRGSIARYMSQPEDQLPLTREDFVWPTQTFHDRLELEIGGETFVLQHHRGETDDQLYVWVPGRGALASADYYQGFLPNGGNGKRVQRHIEDWAVALREMADLEPKVLLPAHGEGSTDTAQIQRDFRRLAEAFESIAQQTIDGLNRGLRKDEVVRNVKLPEHLASDHKLREHYVTVQDVAKMVARQYTGWWDDWPSHWTPVDSISLSRSVLEETGGMEQLVERTREIMRGDLRLASQYADWAFEADPTDPLAQQLVIDVYRERILDPGCRTQEALVYIDAMTAARQAQIDVASLR